jgi:DNA-binding helix-hairpin-helix protein with protein kinase domain
VINRRRAARRRGGIDFDGIVAAAQRLGSFGEEIGRVASMIQQANEVSGKS